MSLGPAPSLLSGDARLHNAYDRNKIDVINWLFVSFRLRNIN